MRRPPASSTPPAAIVDSGDGPEPPRGRRGVLLLSIVLALVAMAVFWLATTHDFISYDDNLYVTDNAHVRGGLTLEGVRWAFSTLHAANWHPVTWLSHLLDTTLFGTGARGPHVMNVLIHAANAALLFGLLWSMTRVFWRSAMVAALFALHPLHVESVAWVSERKDVLCAFFGLLSLLAYSRFVRKSGAGSRKPEVGGQKPEVGGQKPEDGSRASDFRLPTSDLRSLASIYYVLALFLFALGLMAKPMLVTWPFVMLLLDYWPLQRFNPSTLNSQPSTAWRLVWEKVPFLALSLASCVVTVIAQAHGQAVRTLDQLPFDERLANAMISYARYLGKTFWPVDLVLPYPYPEHWPAWAVIFSSVLVLGGCAIAIRFRRRWPFVPVGWFLFLGTLIPVIGLLQVGAQSIADRYTYVPLTGIFIIAVWGTAEAAARWHWPGKWVGLGCGLILAMCGVRTWNQLGHWQDGETLLRHTIAVTGNNAFAYYDLGTYLERQGQAAAAREAYRLSSQANPRYAKPLNSLGILLANEGRFDEAIEYYRRALALKPDYTTALNNLGVALAGKRQFPEAVAMYEKTLQLDPNNADARYNSGLALAALGRWDEALDQYRRALEIRPEFPGALNGLGIVLQAKGRPDEAIEQYTKALRLKPGDWEAHYNLGYVLMLQRRLDEARSHFQESVRLNPRQPMGQFNLGNLLAIQQKYDEAIACFVECLRLTPDYAPAHKNLGMALARLGRRDDAIHHLKEAIRLKPDFEDAKQQLRALDPQAGE